MPPAGAALCALAPEDPEEVAVPAALVPVPVRPLQIRFFLQFPD